MDSHFTPEAVQQRIVPIPGARNLRDMGGYPTEDGRTVRRGVLFRSGHPGEIQPDPEWSLDRLELRAIVDLRTTDERARMPFPEDLLTDTHYWRRDYDLSRGDIVQMLQDPGSTPDEMRNHMLQSYRKLPEEQHEGIGAVFRLLLERRSPLLVNCTAGKDRTGVACAILLAALGVPHDVVRRDYALSEQLHDPAAALFQVDPNGPFAFLLQVNPEVWRIMMGSAPEFIDATFDELHARHGGIEPYLASAHDIHAAELEELRDLLLETGSL